MLKSKLVNNDIFICLAIFALAITIGVIFSILTPEFPLNRDTIHHYHPIAKSLAEGTGFAENGQPTARVAPGYPFFISLIYRARGNFETVRFAQIFILGGTAVLAYLIARKLVPKKFAILAALNVAVWPYLLLYTQLILTEVLFTFSLVAATYSLAKFHAKPTKKIALLSGLLLGLAALVRPVAMFLPLWIIVMGWKKWLIVLAVFILVLAPWTIRNYMQFNTFITVAGGIEDSIKRAYERLDYTKGSKVLKPGEATILDNVKARLKNIYLFWNPGAGGTNAELLLKQNQLFGVAFLVYKIIFILTVFLAALALFAKREKTIILLGIIIFYFWAVHVMLYPYPRYTLPIMPLVIILAWVAINFLWNRISRPMR